MARNDSNRRNIDTRLCYLNQSQSVIRKSPAHVQTRNAFIHKGHNRSDNSSRGYWASILRRLRHSASAYGGSEILVRQSEGRNGHKHSLRNVRLFDTDSDSVRRCSVCLRQLMASIHRRSYESGRHSEYRHDKRRKNTHGQGWNCRNNMLSRSGDADGDTRFLHSDKPSFVLNGKRWNAAKMVRLHQRIRSPLSCRAFLRNNLRRNLSSWPSRNGLGVRHGLDRSVNRFCLHVNSSSEIFMARTKIRHIDIRDIGFLSVADDGGVSSCSYTGPQRITR